MALRKARRSAARAPAAAGEVSRYFLRKLSARLAGGQGGLAVFLSGTYVEVRESQIGRASCRERV